MSDDAGQRAALPQVASCFGREEAVNPFVTVLDHTVAEHLRDLFESLLSLLTRLSDRTIMSSTIRDISLYLRPE